MLTKFGFVVLIVLFGAFAFAGGMMAPATWRQSAQNVGERLSHALSSLVATARSDSAIASATKASATLALPAPASPAASASSKASPPSLSDLLVKTTVEAPAPATGQPAYALKLGQFVTEDEAIAAQQRWQPAADGLNLPLTTLSVVDSQQQPWTLVAIGQFISAAAAQQMAARVQLAFKIQSTPVIQMPPSAKPAS
ncbi:hypothetical protein DWU98_15980 [Dyella monticola]|uniref:SPOR domain-containing protein n=1 Tax=Dyella monticola TaxID=1927958 RepID=A0A370WV97_9GAMM|nr:SPOR domain-containing protein [Dyella monticola]RDS79937.1 hypothetical protein DWU98_15980 [Dyella monticola]